MSLFNRYSKPPTALPDFGVKPGEVAIPVGVRTSLGDDGDPLWYSGIRQVTPPEDIRTIPLDPRLFSGTELLAEPLAVGPSGKHPEAILIAEQ